MPSNNILSAINGNKEIIETPAYIEITKNTFRFGAKVYQFRNITGFGLTHVDKKRIIPLAVILLGFLWGFYLLVVSAITSIFSSNNNGYWGIIIVALSCLGIAFNESQPPRYGFLLELNSGSNRIFVTKDLEGVEKIVSKLYELMENDTEDVYRINIDQRHASIGVGYAEQFNARKVGGYIHNNDD